jgi:branched-subunit amino acid ABC-type transport system permease component
MVILETNLIAGIVLGGIFSLAALGIILVYRVTGVLNLAHGAMGMFSTFVAWKVLHDLHPFAPTAGEAFRNRGSIAVGVLVALGFSVLLGIALEYFVFRRVRNRPQVVKAVITVGVLLVLQSAGSLIFGGTQYHEALRFFDTSSCANPGDCYVIHLGPNVVIGYDQVLVIVTAISLAAGLAVFLKFSPFGKAMRSVADDPVAAQLWGVRVNAVGSVSWILGSLLAAVSGILLISVGVTFDTVSLTVLVVDALAAALIGGLVSLPLAVAGGFLLGLLETFPRLWIQSNGLPKVIAMVVILGLLVARSERSLLRTSTGR